MNGTLFSEIFDAKSSFMLAALVTTWAAFVLLALIAGNLHARLTRLEQAQRMARSASAYGHLIGRPFAVSGTNRPEIVLVLSSNCNSCERILDELWEARRTRSRPRAAIVWKDGVSKRELPDGVHEFPAGARLIAELGIGVTPFALELDAEGIIVKAGPVASLSALGLEERAVAAHR
jgi:hypothetical protein